MNKLFWVYAVAAALAAHARFSFAEPAKPQPVDALVLQAKSAQPEDIARLQQEIDRVRMGLKKKPDAETRKKAALAQRHLDRLLGSLAGVMR